ncbi:MAG: Uma2 family endonuclease [Planctomycetia bacterium]|nr:Uma2 family endonuclease [Planctomycetia bacterium]
MTTAAFPTAPAPIPTPPTSVEPQPIKWTCDDFYLMGGLPSVRDRKIMLIDGEVLVMAAPGPLASISHGLAEDWLRTVFSPDQFSIRSQLGMFFGINTDPMPDIAVVQGPPRAHARHPRTALLIIEVADTTLASDTGDKASLYAAAGIQDYWVLDVNDRRLHVFRDPQPDPTAEYGDSYKQVRVLLPTDTISPLHSASHVVQVNDLLP